VITVASNILEPHQDRNQIPNKEGNVNEIKINRDKSKDKGYIRTINRLDNVCQTPHFEWVKPCWTMLGLPLPSCNGIFETRTFTPLFAISCHGEQRVVKRKCRAEHEHHHQGIKNHWQLGGYKIPRRAERIGPEYPAQNALPNQF